MSNVEPLKISIEGDFWDCQIYKGFLYLWSMDGTLTVLRWEDLIEDCLKKTNSSIAIKYGFLDADHFYKQRKKLTNDPTFKKRLLEDFKKVTKNFFFQKSEWKNFIAYQKDNPFDDLQTDTEIHYDQIFAATDIGLLKITTDTLKNLNFHKAENLLETPILSVKASKQRLALSGGEKGLFEINLKHIDTEIQLQQNNGNSPDTINKGVYQVSKKHSSFSNWNFSSIYSSSYVDSSYLAAYDWVENKSENNKVNFEIEFKNSISEKNIFDDSILEKNTFKSFDLSWGLQEKIYKYNGNELNIVKYKQGSIGKKNYSENFTQLTSFPLDEMNGNLVSGGVALFGVIIESDNSLIVIQSNKNPYKIVEPVTRWRVYPRSKRYLNHLHIILEDKLEIYSFNHDYFENQKEKILGIEYDNNVSDN